MKFIALLVAVVAVVLLAAAVAHLVVLSRRIRSSRNPLAHLPWRERRAYARELLQRERDTYNLQRQNTLEDIIFRSRDN